MPLILDEWQKEILNTKGNILLVSGRQVGKSTIIAKKSGDYAMNNSKKSVLIISATERQAEELFIKTLFHIQDRAAHLIMKGKNRPTKHIIRLINGSIIRCLPTGLSGTGIRGFTIDLLIADEAAYINEEVWTAVTPMLLTTGGDIILVSTPKGKEGYFWKMYNSGSFKVFHIKSEEVMLNRPISSSWTEIQREKAIERLELEKKLMSRFEYLQEYCGEFLEDLMNFFSYELVKSCMTIPRVCTPLFSGDFYLGVDIARMGDDETVFCIVQKVNKTSIKMIDCIVTTKTKLNETTQKILALDKAYSFKNIYIDDGGLGVGVFDYLLENDQTKRKVIALNNRARPLDKDEKYKKKMLKEDLYNNLLGLMERGEVEFLQDEDILHSFMGIQYEYISKAKSTTKLRIFGKKGINGDHIVEAITRACYCSRDKRLNIWVR